MKRLAFCLSALLAIVVALFLPTVLAAAPVRTQTAIDFVLAENSGCSVTPESYLLAIVNASSVYDCDATGGGTVTAICLCDGGSIRGAVVEDVESYVLITLAGQQSVSATGAGNDVTVNAADDVILVPTDALTVTPGGAAAITTTAGAITLTAGGTTQDASIISTDDIFLTPDDALTAVAGGAVTLTATAGTMAIASSAGAITVTAVGATNDVSLVAADDVLLTPTDALTAAVGGAAAVTTTAGAITLTAGGTTQDISLISVDQVILDGEGGADELTIDAASTTVIGAFKLTPSTAPPVACSAGTEGTIYVDADIHKACICNATAYVLMNDDSTTTGCS